MAKSYHSSTLPMAAAMTFPRAAPVGATSAGGFEGKLIVLARMPAGVRGVLRYGRPARTGRDPVAQPRRTCRGFLGPTPSLRPRRQDIDVLRVERRPVSPSDLALALA